MPDPADSADTQPDAPTGGTAARPYAWRPLAVLAATQALETGERQSLAQAVEGIKDTFLVSDAAVGVLPTAVTVVGVLAAMPVGTATDRWRRTWLVTAGVAIWAVGTMGVSLAPTFALLLIARLTLGAMEAAAPPTVSLLADYYAVTERAKIMGLYQGGALIGGLVGLLGGGLVVAQFGWRAALGVWAPLGLVVAYLVTRLPEPVRGERDREVDPAVLGATPVAAAAEDTSDVGLLEALRRLSRIRTFRIGLIAIGVSQLLLTGLQFWGVPYFRRVHELSPAAAGGVTALLGLGSAIGVLGGGWLADRYVRRGILEARVYVVGGGAIAASLVLTPAFFATELLVTAPLFLLGGIFLTMPIAPAEAVLADVVVADLRGRSSAIRSIVRGVSHVGPVLIGLLSSALGLRMALTVFAPVYALGGLLVLTAASSYREDLARVIEASRTS